MSYNTVSLIKMVNTDDDFFDDPDEQSRYINRINELKNKFIELYGEYDSVLHDWYITQIARSEIIIDRLERMVANDTEGTATLKHLSKERSHLAGVQEQMQVSIRSIRGDKSRVEIDPSKDFKELMATAMSQYFNVRGDGNDKEKGK